MVNDADAHNALTTLKYVDDLTLIETRSRVKPLVMQDHFHKFSDWAKNNHIESNPSKYAHMKVSFLKKQDEDHALTVDQVPLQEVSTTKIPGRHVSSDLKLSNHIREVLKKANCRLYPLKLLKHFNLPTDDLVFVTICFGSVRPTVECAAPLWDPGLTVHKDLALEWIQKRACSIIVGKDYTTCNEALELCNLQALHGRREQLCLSFFNSLLDSDRFNSGVAPRRGTIHGRVLRNSDKLALPKFRTVRYQHSPLLYMTKLYNDHSSQSNFVIILFFYYPVTSMILCIFLLWLICVADQ